MPDSTMDLSPAKTLGPTRSILCINADDDSRLLIAEILYEYDVDFALTADDAIQLAHYRTYDLYLLDPAIPGFGDFDLIDELRRYDADVPLVLCCAPDGVSSSDGRVQAQLQKPLSARTVRETALRLLSGDTPCAPNRSQTAAVPAVR